ncbi:MAG: hypothetical protein ACU84J_08260 [Gammaproteobacteria bacterium]
MNQPAEWLTVAAFQGENGETQYFARNGENWEVWDGDIGNIPAAGTTEQLLQEQQLQLFEGQFQGVFGTFSVFTGYRLENGNIVYNRFPTVFSVE